MNSVCAEQQHKFHQQLLRDIDIPPRKLLLGRRSHHHQGLASADMFSGGSPRFSAGAEESAAAAATLLQKFLPYNSGEDSDSDSGDPYSSDHFRMYEFKVRRCTRSRSHDWTDCPFAHPGEKARRRDPRRHHYSGTVCSEYRRGGCSRGDTCEFAHGVFECWLHPARYRTEVCKDGKNCKRKVCFFAHTPRQLRILPLHHSAGSGASSPELLSPPAAAAPAVSSPPSLKKYHNNSNHCCVFCACGHHSISSPTSTLLGMSHLSPPISPPMSPAAKQVFSPISGYKERYGGLDQVHAGAGSYKDALTDLMSSLDALHFSEASASSPVSPISCGASAGCRNIPWVDVSFGGDDQPQFILSPSTPNPSGSVHKFFGSGGGGCSSKSKSKRYINDVNFDVTENIKLNDINGGSDSDPDLGWVNELLM